MTCSSKSIMGDVKIPFPALRYPVSTALHFYLQCNLLLSPGDMTLIRNYITQATQGALKEQRRVREGQRGSGSMEKSYTRLVILRTRCTTYGLYSDPSSWSQKRIAVVL